MISSLKSYHQVPSAARHPTTALKSNHLGIVLGVVLALGTGILSLAADSKQESPKERVDRLMNAFAKATLGNDPEGVGSAYQEATVTYNNNKGITRTECKSWLRFPDQLYQVCDIPEGAIIYMANRGEAIWAFDGDKFKTFPEKDKATEMQRPNRLTNPWYLARYHSDPTISYQLLGESSVDGFACTLIRASKGEDSTQICISEQGWMLSQSYRGVAPLGGIASVEVRSKGIKQFGEVYASSELVILADGKLQKTQKQLKIEMNPHLSEEMFDASSPLFTPKKEDRAVLIDVSILPAQKLPVTVAVVLNKEYAPNDLKRFVKTADLTLKVNLPRIFEKVVFLPSLPEDVHEYDLVLVPGLQVEFLTKNPGYLYRAYRIRQSLRAFSPDNAFSISADSVIGDEKTKRNVEDASREISETFGSIMRQFLSDPDSRLANYANALIREKTLPAVLAVKPDFDDKASILPNSTLDAGEQASVLITVQNTGQGKGFGVSAEMASNRQDVQLQNRETIGDIPPGELRELRVPVNGSVDLSDGQADLIITLRETRGYDSKPQILRVPTRHMDRPRLTISSHEFNDGNEGRGEGNGNGIVESGETVELVGFVKNEGTGDGVGVSLKLEQSNPGIEVLTREASLGTVRPGETARGKLSFRVPRTYSGGDVKVGLAVSDVRTGPEQSKEFALNFKSQTPLLAYKSRVLRGGTEAIRVNNGDAIEIEITPENHGSLTARGVTLSVSAPEAGLSASRVTIGDINPAATSAPLRFKAQVPRSFAGSSLSVSVQLEQADFPSQNAAIEIPVDTLSPRLTYTAAIAGRADSTVEQGEQVRVTVQVGNEGSIEARDLKVSLGVANSEVRITGPKEAALPRLSSKSISEALNFDLYFTGRVPPGPLPLQITVTQADFPATAFSHEVQVKPQTAAVVAVTPTAPKSAPPASQAQAPSPGPAIALGAPPDQLRTYDAWVDLTGTAVDARGIDSIQVRVNGKPARLEIRGAAGIGQREFSARIALDKGENRIEVIARNLDNLTSQQTRVVFLDAADSAHPTVPPLAGYSDVDSSILGLQPTAGDADRRKWAVVLGVETYRGAPPVPYARRDAQAFRELTARRLRIPAENIFALYDDEVTLGAMRDVVEDSLAAHVRAGDTVYFFFAGHGVPDVGNGTPYLLPADGKPANPRRTGYPLSDLYSVLGALPAERVFVFLDACFSGSAARQADPTLLVEGIRPVVPTLKEIALPGKNLVVFSATGPSQVSNAYSEMQHGLFTYFVLKGLLGTEAIGASGTVTAEDLGQYVKDRVSETARRELGPTQRQDPMVRTSPTVNDSTTLK